MPVLHRAATFVTEIRREAIETKGLVLLKLDCCMFVCLFVCLSRLYYSDGGIETAFIIEL